MWPALRWLKGISFTLLLLAALLVVIGLQEARSDAIERRLTLGLAGWPTDTPPITIALLSDIHLGNRAMDAERLERIVSEVNAERPDLVLLAGDFMVGHDAAGASQRAIGLQAPLSRLTARLGVIAVLGNHDHWTSPSSVRAALARAGVKVLQNEAVRRGPITILGIDDAFSGHDDVSATLASWRRVGGMPLVLTHAPDVALKLPSDLPLVMAGHTHCGQLVLPWIGPLLARSPKQQWRALYEPRYRCGVVQDRGRLVLVTAGLGSGTSPLRIGAPPDWWLIRIGARRPTHLPAIGIAKP